MHTSRVEAGILLHVPPRSAFKHRVAAFQSVFFEFFSDEIRERAVHGKERESKKNNERRRSRVGGLITKGEEPRRDDLE